MRWRCIRLPSLIEARRRVTDSRYEELLVVEIDTELPQDTDYDIRSPERLAFSFERSDRGYPAVLALRTDFSARVAPVLDPGRGTEEPVPVRSPMG